MKGHGNFNLAFNFKCPCNECVLFRRNYLKQFRAKQREQKAINKHGTLHAYNVGCRCDECKMVQREYRKK
jgi:hypothetical protein